MMAAPARATMGIRDSANPGRSRIGWYHTQMQPTAALDWSAIDTVLLDMDGTLLDLRFDNWFWLELIPGRYAAAQRTRAEEEARARLAPGSRRCGGRCSGTASSTGPGNSASTSAASSARRCAQVRFLPGAEEFLANLQASGKRRVLVTNAHPEDFGHQERAGGADPVLRRLLLDSSIRCTQGTCGVLAALGSGGAIFSRSAPCSSMTAWRCSMRAHDFGIGWLRAVRRAGLRIAAAAHRRLCGGRPRCRSHVAPPPVGVPAGPCRKERHRGRAAVCAASGSAVLSPV